MGALVDIVASSERLGDATRATYVRCVALFEAFAPDARSWSPATVEVWRRQLQQGRGPATVNKYLHALRYATRRYEVLGHGRDFARSAESVRGQKSPRRQALSVEEAQRLVGACRGLDPLALRDRAIVVVAIRTGLRASELAALRWSAIDGRRAVVKVKGNRTHTAFLDDECLRALRHWRSCLDATPRRRLPAQVFCSVSRDLEIRLRGPLSRQGIHRIIVQRAQQAGIRRSIYPHLLRHTCISWALEAGVPAPRVMAMVGHRSLQTLSGYVTDLQAEADPVGGYLPRLT